MLLLWGSSLWVYRDAPRAPLAPRKPDEDEIIVLLWWWYVTGGYGE